MAIRLVKTIFTVANYWSILQNRSYILKNMTIEQLCAVARNSNAAVVIPILPHNIQVDDVVFLAGSWRKVTRFPDNYRMRTNIYIWVEYTDDQGRKAEVDVRIPGERAVLKKIHP